MGLNHSMVDGEESKRICSGSQPCFNEQARNSGGPFFNAEPLKGRYLVANNQESIKFLLLFRSINFQISFTVKHGEMRHRLSLPRRLAYIHSNQIFMLDPVRMMHVKPHSLINRFFGCEHVI